MKNNPYYSLWKPIPSLHLKYIYTVSMITCCQSTLVKLGIQQFCSFLTKAVRDINSSFKRRKFRIFLYMLNEQCCGTLS